jgi:L-fuconolactonase
MEAALEAFTPRRLILGSDWPVCLLAGSYEEVLGTYLEFTGKLSEAEQHCIHSQNAMDSYNL